MNRNIKKYLQIVGSYIGAVTTVVGNLIEVHWTADARL